MIMTTRMMVVVMMVVIMVVMTMVVMIFFTPVVLHKAVAEVSREDAYRRDWSL